MKQRQCKESERVELKKSLSQLDDGIKAVCSFLNHKGGTLYFGIRIKPEISPEVKEKKVSGKSIVEVKIAEGKNKPYFLNGVAYKRVGSENRILPADELREILLDQQKSTWDEQICFDATAADIDDHAVQRFITNASIERRLEISRTTRPSEALIRLGLLKKKKYTNAAVLLFGKNPQQFFSQAEVRCARFKGNEPIHFIDMKVFGRTVIDQVEDTLAFVKQHIQLAAQIKGTERVETWEYPLEAIREAIINAICHRNYSLSGNVQIRIFDASLEIWGCGSLPSPLLVEDLKKKHRSVLRNRLIGKCFFLIKFIEEWGTGTNRIIEECKRLGFPEPVFEEIMGTVVITFRKKISSFNVMKTPLEMRQEKLLLYLKEKHAVTSKQYALHLSCSLRTANDDLREFVKKKVIQTKTKGRYIYYIL